MNSNSCIHGVLVVLMGVALCFQVPAAQANIVSTKEMAAHSRADADRAKVRAFLDRADVRARLQALGVNGLLAKDRVAALDDQEVHLLARKIDSLPAGGSLKNLTNSDMIVLLLAAILLVLIV